MRLTHAVFVAATAFFISLFGVGKHVSSQDAVEEVSWRVAVSAGTVDAYKRFLQQHPTSQYASDAFRAMVAANITADRDNVDPQRLSSGRYITGIQPTVLVSMY